MDEEFGEAALAIVVGDLDALGALLQNDPGLATRRSTVGHPTLLQLIACEEKNLVDPAGSARLLVEAGADPAGPLVAAAGCSGEETLNYLLDHGAAVDGDGGWSALDEAVYWDNDRMVQLLLERGATATRLSTCAGLGDATAVEAFFEADGLTAAAGPVRSPFPDTVPAALADDPQAIIDHAFVMAVNGGQQPVAALLLATGAGINATPPGFHWKGTALHAACWRGNRELVDWLLTNGADPTIRDGLADSDAPGWAEHHGHSELAAHLRALGVDG